MNAKRQRGAVLLMSLILLMMMTVFVISSVNISNLSLKIVGNMQNQKALDSAAQQAIEDVLSRSTKFNTPSTTTLTIGGQTVSVTAPDCIYSARATGYSATNPLSPEDNIWEIVATVTDATSGATATIHQGVKMRQLAGRCI